MSTAETQPTGHPLHQIYFYLTEGCNLRCRHCWVLPEKNTPRQADAFLKVELFENIVEQGRDLGLHTVKLTGGEPFLHPQAGHILEIIKSADLRLVVETNGVLLTPELAEAVVGEALRMAGYEGHLSVAGQEEPTPLFNIEELRARMGPEQLDLI